MAYLQILNGARAQEFVELSPNATFIIGSAPDAHVRLQEADVAPRHAQVYPAQGSYWLQDLGAGNTIHGMRRLVGDPQGLQPLGIFIVGQAFLQFWPEKPLAASGKGAPAGASSDDGRLAQLESELAETRQLLEVFQNAVDERESELEVVRKEATSSNERRIELEHELQAVRQKGDTSDEQVGLLQQELAAAREQLEVDLAEAKRELVSARARLVEAEGRADQFQRELIDREEQLNKTKKGSETARVDAKRLQVELGVAESRAREEIEQAREEAKARLYEKDAELNAVREQLQQELNAVREQLQQELNLTRSNLEQELAATQQALEAARAAVELLGAQAPGDVLSSDSALGAALDHLSLEPDSRRRLETAVVAEVEREGLRRYSGAVLTWAATPQRDLERELQAVRARSEEAQLALHLQLPAVADESESD